LLVSTGAVSCYPALMVNLIWSADKKCLSCQHMPALSNMWAEVRCLSSQKLNYLAGSVCWCIVLLEAAISSKSQAIPRNA